MEGKKTVKWKLKVGESIHIGDTEVEMVKQYGSGRVADLLIHIPDDGTMVHRGKKRGDGLRENDSPGTDDGKTVSEP